MEPYDSVISPNSRTITVKLTSLNNKVVTSNVYLRHNLYVNSSNLTKKKMLQQQDLSKKGEDLVKFVFSNELKMALIVYKDNTLEIKYY